jgi:hypothetical protein
MAKISDRERHQYLQKISPYREAIGIILKRERELLILIQKGSGDVAFTRLALVDEMLNLASNYIILNGVSLSMLKVKNEDALNDGRKSL